MFQYIQASILALRVVSRSGQYLAPTPNLVSLDPTVQSTWTAVSSLLLIRWNTDPANSELSFLNTTKPKTRHQTVINTHCWTTVNGTAETSPPPGYGKAFDPEEHNEFHERYIGDWIEHGFTSAPTQYRLYGRRFLQVWWPNQQCQSTEGRWLVIQTGLNLTRLTSHSATHCTLTGNISPQFHWRLGWSRS